MGQTCRVHLVLAPFDWTSAGAWLYKHPAIASQNDKPSISVTKVVYESSCEVIYAPMPRTFGGIWACGCVSCQGCPRINCKN